MNEKVAVIFWDALEYEGVEEWDLQTFKQEEYGEMEVPKRRTMGSDFPTTPAVFATFLTGKMPEEHGIWRFKQSNSFMHFLSKIPYLGIDRAVRKIFGVESDFVMPDREELGFPTLIDEVENVVEVNFPYYSNESHEAEMKQLKEFVDEEVSTPELKERMVQRMEGTLDETLREVEEEWDLFLGYFPYLDGIQHTFSFDKEYVKQCYEKAEGVMEKIKSKISEDTWVLIMSDHGSSLEKGTHSHHGFYSSNREMDLEEPHIVDIHNLIKEGLNIPTDKEKEKVKEELEKLGYI